MTYSVADGVLSIVDPVIDLEVRTQFLMRQVPEGWHGVEGLKVVRDDDVVREAYFQRDGLLEGQYISYYDSQLPKVECYYLIHGGLSLLHGPSKAFASNGQIVSLVYFVEGKRQGCQRRWYPSGVEAARMYFKDDALHGPYEVYYENGVLKTRMAYVEGVVDGTVELFHDNGLIKRRLTYHHGQRIGLDAFWTYAGNPLSEKYFDKGVLVQEKYWSEAGILVEECTHHDEMRSDIIKYDSLGTKRISTVYQGERFEHHEWDEGGGLVKHYKGYVEEQIRNIDDFILGQVSPIDAKSLVKQKFTAGTVVRGGKSETSCT